MTAGPVSPIPQEARPFQGQRAGVVTRVLASCVDAVVVALLLLLLYAVVAGARWVLQPRNFQLPEPSLFIRTTTVFVLLVAYLAFGWATSGRTYGCHVMGLRVVNFRGNRMNPLGALLRAAFCAFFPVGLLWCAVNRNNRSVQDLVLRSSVIYDWNPRAPWRRPDEPTT